MQHLVSQRELQLVDLRGVVERCDKTVGNLHTTAGIYRVEAHEHPVGSAGIAVEEMRVPAIELPGPRHELRGIEGRRAEPGGREGAATTLLRIAMQVASRHEIGIRHPTRAAHRK